MPNPRATARAATCNSQLVGYLLISTDVRRLSPSNDLYHKAAIAAELVPMFEDEIMAYARISRRGIHIT